jgi:hypothetical protein
MYKCGWNGCEKAYGTLNHLNAHVTMQSHGSKRTPEGQSELFTRIYVHAFCPALEYDASHTARVVCLSKSARALAIMQNPSLNLVPR